MDPFEFVARIPCPSCRVGIGERCVTTDGYVHQDACLHRVKLTKWPDADTLPDSHPDSEQDDGDYGRSVNE